MKLALTIAAAFSSAALGAHTNNILVTGYWPPTNEMLRPFSTNPAQNAGGWQGGNWEGRGYNIHSYFPEFPGGMNDNPQGDGDFQVDYQFASADFWRITAELQPVAIITFSRGAGPLRGEWEIESRHRALGLDDWADDYEAPFRPTADLPFASEPTGTIRNSSLPMAQIRDAVNAAGLGFTARIDTSDAFGGTFVSEFTGYHSSWYANMHSDPNDPAWCVAGGHVHVGRSTPLAGSMLATEITLRELIAYVDTQVPGPGTVGALGAFVIFRPRRRAGV